MPRSSPACCRSPPRWPRRSRFASGPSPGFWVCAVLGCALVVGFAAWKGGGSLVPRRPAAARAVASAVDRLRRRRARCRPTMPAEQRDLLGAGAEPAAHAAGCAARDLAGAAGQRRGLGRLRLCHVFSMWLGFFAWYRGLALGGTVRVSQVQLVQPFLSLLFAVPVLGERLDAATLGFLAGGDGHRLRRPARCRSRRPAAAPIAELQFTTRPSIEPTSPWRLARAHRADEPVGDPRDPEAHRAARHHLAGRRPAVARHLPGRGDARGHRRACCATTPREALQYAASEGFAPLREWVADEMARPGPRASTPTQVLITTGSQQGLDLVGKVLIDAGSRSRSRRPPTSARCRPSRRTSPSSSAIACDDDGPLPEALAAAAAAARASSTCCPTSRTRAAAAIGAARRAAIVAAPRRRRPAAGRGQPLRRALVRRRAAAAAGLALARGHDLPGLVLQGARAGPAPGLRGRAGRAVPEAAAGQAGRRPAHAGLQPARGARGDQGRLPRPARADDPRPLQGAARRDGGARWRPHLPGRLPLAAAAAAACSSGSAAGGLRRDGAAAQGGRAGVAYVPGAAFYAERRDAEHDAPVVRHAGARATSHAAWRSLAPRAARSRAGGRRR